MLFSSDLALLFAVERPFRLARSSLASARCCRKPASLGCALSANAPSSTCEAARVLLGAQNRLEPGVRAQSASPLGGR